jgi:diadenylate cyclase
VSTPEASFDARLKGILARVAPGTELHDGLERILRGRTGALIVLGFDRSVEHIANGGFTLDVPFSATRLRELSKMDGAVILDTAGSTIVRAAVQLVPDASLATDETGTRHRTADRVSRQTGYPVISVSKSMNIIALYVDGRRYVLDDTSEILTRANQALATLERYKSRLDEVDASLFALEIENLVTVRDIATTSQRLEMVRRIASEIESYVVELGVEGRLLSLQLNELVAGVETDRALLVRDYLAAAAYKKRKGVESALSQLDALTANELLDLAVVADAYGFTGGSDLLDQSVQARGYRILARVPRLSEVITDRLVAHFAGLQRLLAAGIDDLQQVEGVGEARARSVREGLSRIAESSILERFM